MSSPAFTATKRNYTKAYQTTIGVNFDDLQKHLPPTNVGISLDVLTASSPAVTPPTDSSVSPASTQTGQLDINSLLQNLDKNLVTPPPHDTISQQSVLYDGATNNLPSGSSGKKRFILLFVFLCGGAALFYLTTTNPIFFEEVWTKVAQTFQPKSGTGNGSGEVIVTPLSDSLSGKKILPTQPKPSLPTTTLPKPSTEENPNAEVEEVDTEKQSLIDDLAELFDEVVVIGQKAKTDKNEKTYAASQALLKNIKKLQENINKEDVDFSIVEKSIKNIKKVIKKIE